MSQSPELTQSETSTQKLVVVIGEERIPLSNDSDKRMDEQIREIMLEKGMSLEDLGGVQIVRAVEEESDDVESHKRN